MSRSSACALRNAKSQQRRRIEWTHGANGLTLINLMRIVLSLLVLLGQDVGQPVASRDFTADRLFTRDIEGPEIHRAGRRFVVNFGKDGTVGLVHADGRAERFVELPPGSTANAI